MTLGLFNEIFVIFVISMFVLYFCSRLKIPAIVGYLFTGALLGPYGVKLVQATHEVEYLAEIGVVLLLFTIGIEFSFKKLLQIRKALIIGGFTQLILTIAVVTFILYEFGYTVKQSIFISFLISLSSTAIVLKYLQEKAEIDTLYGQTSLAILIFQDLVIVPMILLTPLLTDNPAAAAAAGPSIWLILFKIAGIVFLIITGTKFIVPKILYYVAKTRNQDLFLLTIIVICASVAVLTSKAGLSLALGAFLAGLIISESEYSHQALGYVLPFKSIFTSFFFVSIGMLLNVQFIMTMPWTITALTIAVILIKTVTAYIGGAFLKVPTGSALLAGFALCQIGEFSFVLSKTGVENAIINNTAYQIFLSVAVLTMILTPVIIYSVNVVLRQLVKLKYLKILPEVGNDDTQSDEFGHLKEHLIIIGYGINGKNLACAAKASKIPYIISDVNPETVRREKINGEPIVYGDATYESVLEHLNIKCAKIIVIAVPDRIALRRIVELSRKMNENVYIMARTRFFSEVDEIKKLGADEVIPEEFETSIEIFTRVMQKYLIPQNEIEDFINFVRKGSYKMFRTPNNSSAITDMEFKMPDLRISTYRVSAGNEFKDKTLAEIGLRQKYGLTLIGIARNSVNIINPSGDEKILENDTLIFIGDVKVLNNKNIISAVVSGA